MRLAPDPALYDRRQAPWWLRAATHVVLCGVALGQDEPVSVETIERARHAAVPVVCLVEKPAGTLTPAATLGSGFLVNEEGYFMTAAHVIGSDEALGKGKLVCAGLAVYFPKGGWDADLSRLEPRLYPFTECTKDTRHDLAVCRLHANPFLDPLVNKWIGPLAFAAPSVPPDGTPVAFTGFPLHLVRPVTSKANVASYQLGNPMLMIDKTAWPGASGSALYRADGTVVGMVVQTGTNQGAGLSYARPAPLLADFLTKNKIAFRRHKQK